MSACSWEAPEQIEKTPAGGGPSPSPSTSERADQSKRTVRAVKGFLLLQCPLKPTGVVSMKQFVTNTDGVREAGGRLRKGGLTSKMSTEPLR